MSAGIRDDGPIGICDEHGDDMDDCPVCERVTRYDGEKCTECGRLWGIDYSQADMEARRLREKAERIALQAVREYGYSDYPKTHDSESSTAYAVATAAALAALTGTAEGIALDENNAEEAQA